MVFHYFSPFPVTASWSGCVGQSVSVTVSKSCFSISVEARGTVGGIALLKSPHHSQSVSWREHTVAHAREQARTHAHSHACRHTRRTYTHTHTHTRTHTYIMTHTHEDLLTHTHTQIRHTNICIHTHTHKHTQAHTATC